MNVNPSMKGSTQGLLERRAKAIARGVGMAAPVFAQKAENAGDMGRRGPPLHRFRRRHRRAQYRPPPSQGDEARCRSSSTASPTPASRSCPMSRSSRSPRSSTRSRRSRAPKKTMFVTTGAEAVENAVKIARAATGRTDVIAFAGALPRPHAPGHGADRQGRSLQDEVRALPAAASGTCPSRSRTRASRSSDSLKALEWLFKTDVEPDARWRPSSSSRCRARAASTSRRRNSCGRLRKLCDEHGIVLDRRRDPDGLRAHRQDGSPWSMTASSPIS